MLKFNGMENRGASKNKQETFLFNDEDDKEAEIIKQERDYYLESIENINLDKKNIIKQQENIVKEIFFVEQDINKISAEDVNNKNIGMLSALKRELNLLNIEREENNAIISELDSRLSFFNFKLNESEEILFNIDDQNHKIKNNLLFGDDVDDNGLN